MPDPTPEERATLRAWNERAFDDAPLRSVPALFREQAALRPEALAVRSVTGQLTYGELASRAEALARLLLARGARPGDRVAVCMERGTDLVVALLGILEAGCAYLPLEPTYPKARLELLVSDAAPPLCLCDRALAPIVPMAVPRLVFEELDLARAPHDAALPEVDPEDIAYVLYTSGSTGTPKGVEVPHRAIDRLVKGVRYAELGPDTVILQAAPVAFDASTFELWGALLNGGQVVPHPEAIPTARGLGEVIRRFGATTMWLTAALFNAVVDDDPTQLASLRQLLTGGEALSVAHVRRAYAHLPTTQLINGYGPTETTTFSNCHPIPRDLPASATSVPIGRAIRRTRLYVLDDARRPVAIGEEGELYIGGDGVARGYLARPELTAERFLDDPFVPGARVYRTGDRVRFLEDGVVDYVGRIDQQVKVRGFRIELGEIEHAIAALPGVKRNVVTAQPGPTGEKRLVAYVVMEQPGEALDVSAARASLAATLPDYMVPAIFVPLDAIPVTPNGKVDHRALPAPAATRPELAVAYRAPASPTEKKLAEVWSAALGVEPLGVLDNFFDLGASSLLVLRTVAALEREHGITLAVVRVFEHPTVAELASILDGGREGASFASRISTWEGRRARMASTDVAIIGMSGRFPGAPSVESFWESLLAGVDGVSHWEPAELDPSIPRELIADPAYVPARGVLDDVDLFDAAFFGITPREAELMDPQQRILLEEAWKALEDAGYVPGSTPDTIGIFAGKYNASYFANNVQHRPDLIAEFGAFPTMLANEKDYIATRVAHRLNLKGPAISIHSACSTSLVAVVQAVQSLQLGQCDLALAGGVSIVVPVKSGYLYQEGEMLSPDGRTRTFDVNAQGTVFSDGVAVVLLKRLADAVEDRDTIHGVIRGVAVNNDGGEKSSFTAPSIEGQATVIAMAQRMAGVDPADIGYVEAHGTATPLGDPIEVEALTQAFRLRTDGVGFCGLGSVKSNVGHLVIAAGATGLIKTALSLEKELIPRTVGFTAPNPKLHLESSPFRVVAENQPWPRGPKPRVAGVSSFGVGGTNAHVIVEEPPLPAPHEPSARREQLLLVSARSEAALGAASEQLASFLEGHPALPLEDVAFTLHAGRRKFPHSRAVVARDAAEAAALLRAPRPPLVSTQRYTGAPQQIAFMFPGQGAQYAGMGGALYRGHPTFRAEVDRCAELLCPILGEDLRDRLYPPPDRAEEAGEALKQTRLTQPALFVVEYALARLWQSWGAEPSAMIGHSVGEFVCAVLAGVMRLPDALRLVALRGRRMQEQPAGAMLSVRAPAADVEGQLPEGVTVASDNGPELCVVAGPTQAVAQAQAALEARGIQCRPLVTSHAFHSAMMDPVVAPFRAEVEAVELAPPRIPFVSTATGAWITDAEATDPGYWAHHLRAPVRFAPAVRVLLATPGLTLLEVGPRGTLAALARQQIGDKNAQFCVSSLGDSDESTWASMLAAVGRLYHLGVALEPRAVHGPERRRRVPLPTYPFERKRFWVEAPAPGVPAGARLTAAPEAPAPPGPNGADAGLHAVMVEQMRVMEQQLALLLAVPPDAEGDPSPGG